MFINKSEKNSKRRNVRTEIVTESNSERETRLTASLLFLAITITVSYFPVEITLIITVIDDTIASSPNSSGANNRVRMGERMIGIPCETAVPNVRVNEFLINPFLFEKAVMLLFASPYNPFQFISTRVCSSISI